ncbi:MAG: hypothetical protein OHK0013_43950 [Sandaracinaceae bacterium]
MRTSSLLPLPLSLALAASACGGGHVSCGMYTPRGQRNAYGQLAAMQLGVLLDQGAIRWDADAPTADGTHRGAFGIDFARLPAACRELMTHAHQGHRRSRRRRGAGGALRRPARGDRRALPWRSAG